MTASKKGPARGGRPRKGRGAPKRKGATRARAGGNEPKPKAPTDDEMRLLTVHAIELHKAFIARLDQEAPELAADFFALMAAHRAVSEGFSAGMREAINGGRD
jgi:hypothetical protein